MGPELKTAALAIFLLSILSTAAATSFGDPSTEPVPNITSVGIYEVTGLSQEKKRNGGTLVDQGLNETFDVGYDEYRQYRFEFRIANNGTGNWSLKSGDILKHSGLDTSWEVNEVFYNISQARFGGNFSSGTVNWNTTLGGKLEESGENSSMEAAYIVNMSTYSDLYQEKFKVNDTSSSAGSRDRHDLNVTNFGFLNVSTIRPPNNTVLQRNHSFNVTGRAECLEGDCGQVGLSTRYNETGETAETLIPANSGEPLHTLQPNIETCDTNLQRTETCKVNITVNATGPVGSDHAIDVNASSGYSGVAENDSEDSAVVIKSTIIMDLAWSATEFGVISPGTDNVSAEGNDNLQYNITFSEDSIHVDSLFARATNLTSKKNPEYAIRPGNITLGFDQDPAGGFEMDYSFTEIMTDISPGTVVNTFYHLNVPSGMTEGGYNGTMIFKANSTT